MTNPDIYWDIMLELSKLQQQDYFELFAEWTIYRENDYKYLKQNIGFALFGPPTQRKDSDVPQEKGSSMAVVTYKENQAESYSDLTDVLDYNDDATHLINDIFKKICAHGKGFKYNDGICFGIIYNVIFRNKKTSVSKYTTHNESGEEKKLSDEIRIIPTPIFKIQKRVDKLETKNVVYETIYIDKNGRVYKDWSDYKNNNTLPQCTMVLPKDGVYQVCPEYASSEEHSVCWTEVLDSPACSVAATVLSAVDLTSSITGLAGLAVCGVAMVTPVGPAILTASAIGAAANGLWTFGRSTQQLIDRSNHEETINPIAHKDAFTAWLGITGSTVGLAASGGAFVVATAVGRGSNVSTTARVAFNAVMLSNLGINGIGISYQAYCIYEKYMNGERIDTLDILVFASHVLFFSNAVINIQFAGDIINSTQGKVLDDYKSNLRSKRLRKAFNRAKRTAFANNADATEANADVIRYINRKKDFIPQSSVNSSTTANNVSVQNATSENVITLDYISLIDPSCLLDNFQSENFNYESTSENNDSNGEVLEKLRKLIIDLLTDFYMSDQRPTTENLPTISDFEEMFQEMRYVENAEDVLRKVFKICMTLINKCETLSAYFMVLIRFVWSYLKANIKRYCKNLGAPFNSQRMHNLLFGLVTIILEKIDILVEVMVHGVLKYLISNSYIQNTTL